jgi:hypothetical protein
VGLEPDALRALVDEVGRFYVRDRKLGRVQRAMSEALAGGGTPGDDQVRAYLETVRRYFTAFQSEARAHLQQVEARLKRVSQEQYNLAAERGVAARRVEATRSVLSRLPGWKE